MSQDLVGISLSVPSFGPSLDSGNAHRGGSAGSRDESSNGASAIPAAGTFWQDAAVSGSISPSVMNCPTDSGGLLTTGKSCKNRCITVAYVINGELSQTNNTENMALQCLKDACDTMGSKLETVHFGKLDFGETMVLDQFYNAGKFK